MKYKFEKQKKNYSIFSSGNVLYSYPRQPAFPVRLGSEIFQRCVEIFDLTNKKPPYSIYDPFCGSGYLITVLGFLHGEYISKITGSDINSNVVKVAENNLMLLTKRGLLRREKEIEEMYRLYKKKSHLESLNDIKKLLYKYLSSNTEEIDTKVFQSDASEFNSICNFVLEKSIDIIITDIPYGNKTKWIVENKGLYPNNYMIIDAINSLKYFLKPNGVIVIIGYNKIKLPSESRIFILKYLKVGHRHIHMFSIS